MLSARESYRDLYSGFRWGLPSRLLFLSLVSAIAFLSGSGFAWAEGTPEEETEWAAQDRDFAAMEHCLAGVSEPLSVGACLGIAKTSCLERTVNKSRSGDMACFGYETDLWEVVYSNTVASLIARHSEAKASLALLFHAEGRIADFIVAEAQWVEFVKSYCDMGRMPGGASMMAGFHSQRCLWRHYAMHSVHLANRLVVP